MTLGQQCLPVVRKLSRNQGIYAEFIKVNDKLQ